MAANLPERGIPLPDIWLRLKPTNPFRRLDHALEAISILKARPDIDLVRHVNKTELRQQIINAEGFLEPLSADWPANCSVIRRNEFPDTYQVFNLDVLRHANWQKLGSAYMGLRVLPIVGEAITGLDINDRDSFELVKTLIEARPRAAIVERHLVMPATS